MNFRKLRIANLAGDMDLTPKNFLSHHAPETVAGRNTANPEGGQYRIAEGRATSNSVAPGKSAKRMKGTTRTRTTHNGMRCGG